MSLRVYLRRYQASRAMMSSSSDRTSAMGRMWRLGDVSSSEEGGGVTVGRRQRSRKGGGGKGNNINKCIFSKKSRSRDQDLETTTTTTTIGLLRSPLAPGQIQKPHSAAFQIGISLFCAVWKNRPGQDSESRSPPLALFRTAQTRGRELAPGAARVRRHPVTTRPLSS